MFTVFIYDQATKRRVFRCVDLPKAKWYFAAAQACAVTRCVIRKGRFTEKQWNYPPSIQFLEKRPVVAFSNSTKSYSNFAQGQ